jgi:hypothetical protein
VDNPNTPVNNTSDEPHLDRAHEQCSPPRRPIHKSVSKTQPHLSDSARLLLVEALTLSGLAAAVESDSGSIP